MDSCDQMQESFFFAGEMHMIIIQQYKITHKKTTILHVHTVTPYAPTVAGF